MGSASLGTGGPKDVLALRSDLAMQLSGDAAKRFKSTEHFSQIDFKKRSRTHGVFYRPFFWVHKNYHHQDG
jgi:hypothetical protein